MTAMPERPITILIAALGGEGGGVLSDWLVDAATAQGFPVQSTSIPGVAQRTGATTYYVEIFPTRTDGLDGKWPVMALTPSPGNVDIMVASELIEAGRAMQNGFVSPERTTLIASTHRVYAISEKSAMGDGRYDNDSIPEAARQMAKQAILFDMARLAQQSGTVINAVMFGAVAGCGALPLSREACEDAIRKAGKGAESSLRGFAAGYAWASGQGKDERRAAEPQRETPVERVRRVFPPETHAILERAAARLAGYQDADYASLYLDRLQGVLAVDREAGGVNGYQLTNETARYLALWMSYEDVIRVADLKTRGSRYLRVRSEVGAKPGEPVVVTEYLKPGLDELCSLLPAALAKRVRDWAKGRGLENRLNVGLHLKTTTVLGYLLLRAASLLKPLRRRTSRFSEEQALIERWLSAIKRFGFAAQNAELALEIAECARLVKGYGDTHRRGVGNFLRIFDTVIENDKRVPKDPVVFAAMIRRAREAALADPGGAALQRALTAGPVIPLAQAAAGAKPQGMVFMQNAARRSETTPASKT